MKNNTTNTILDTMVNNGILDKISAELGLKAKPYIVYDEDIDSSYVMAATGCNYVTLFTITGSETDGKIKVNLRALEREQKQYVAMCGTKQAAYDITLITLRHECRHLWQYENGFYNGNSTMRFNLNAHGEEPEEKDANDWAMSRCRSPRLKAMAEHMIHLQNYNTIYNNREYYKETRKKMLRMTKQYNKPLYMVYSALSTLV